MREPLLEAPRNLGITTVMEGALALGEAAAPRCGATMFREERLRRVAVDGTPGRGARRLLLGPGGGSLGAEAIADGARLAVTLPPPLPMSVVDFRRAGLASPFRLDGLGFSASGWHCRDALRAWAGRATFLSWCNLTTFRFRFTFWPEANCVVRLVRPSLPSEEEVSPSLAWAVSPSSFISFSMAMVELKVWSLFFPKASKTHWQKEIPISS